MLTSLNTFIMNSKDSKNIGADWAAKLKSDMHHEGAQIAVHIITSMPTDKW